MQSCSRPAADGNAEKSGFDMFWFDCTKDDLIWYEWIRTKGSFQVCSPCACSLRDLRVWMQKFLSLSVALLHRFNQWLYFKRIKRINCPSSAADFCIEVCAKKAAIRTTSRLRSGAAIQPHWQLSWDVQARLKRGHGPTWIACCSQIITWLMPYCYKCRYLRDTNCNQTTFHVLHVTEYKKWYVALSSYTRYSDMLNPQHRWYHQQAQHHLWQLCASSDTTTILVCGCLALTCTFSNSYGAVERGDWRHESCPLETVSAATWPRPSWKRHFLWIRCNSSTEENFLKLPKTIWEAGRLKFSSLTFFDYEIDIDWLSLEMIETSNPNQSSNKDFSNESELE